MAMADLSSFTLEEQLLIISDAEKLIATPDTWVQGHWKCDLYEIDASGSTKRDKLGDPVRKCDAKGNPLYGYCIEGAINEAILQRFGEARAQAVGVFSAENGSEDISGARPARILSVNELARELYGADLAQNVNDTDILDELDRENIFEDDPRFEKFYERKKREIHGRVLNILRTKKRELKTRLGRR